MNSDRDYEFTLTVMPTSRFFSRVFSRIYSLCRRWL